MNKNKIEIQKITNITFFFTKNECLWQIHKRYKYQRGIFTQFEQTFRKKIFK